MTTWHTIRYTRDHIDTSGLLRKIGDEDRVIESTAGYLTFSGIAEFVEKSVAIPSKPSDNEVMSPTASNPVQESFFPEVAPITTYTWSPQQEIVFDFVDNCTGHAVVIAVAGAGKTTTLIECFKRIVKKGQRVVFLAFNNKIAKEIRTKVEAAGLEKSVKISTFHAHGMGIWMKANPTCKVEGDKPGNAGYWKFNRIVDEIEAEHGPMPFMYKAFVRRARDLARQSLFGFEVNLMDKEAWLALVDHYDLDDEIAEIAEEDGVYLSTDELQNHVFQALNWTVRAIRKGIELSREVIDFEDMIYMPLVSQIQVWQNDWVLVDEAQDTNASRRAFVAKILKPTGRTIWVGDPAQAIYGFTGADSQSLETIKQRFGARELSLTISYRCPQSVVRLAKTWVSHIEAHPDAPEGDANRIIQVTDLLAEKLNTTYSNGALLKDVILCRNNRPIVELALALIRRKVPCYVEGKDIAEGLIKLVSRWKSVTSIDGLVEKLESYRDREVQKAMARGKEKKAENIADNVETLLAIIADQPRGTTLDGLERHINDMFFDSEKQALPMLVLSSIHKAKGREWDRVYWYGKQAFQPSKYARKAWQQVQETNLMYVAATRSKSVLVQVGTPQKPGPIAFKEAA